VTPERWQQIQKLLGAALERPADERAGVVAEACAGDEELLQEVTSLLDQASQGSGFLSKPGFATVSNSDTTVAGVTLVGKTIAGRYQVKSRLGFGGMGDVYLADDAQLRCAVALKAIRESGPTAEGRARLLREARAAAALRDHASIAAIYDVLDADDEAGTPALIVMEYVDGENLSDRMRSTRIATGDALRYARDVADALAAAHSRGIMHRDLKPANLRITRDNRIKVLDFGLARRIAIATALPTETSTMTGERAFEALMPRIAGTPGYMSPEQLLGRPIGAPSDVFSLGVVLFEMLSGKRPVAGDDFFSAAQAMMTKRIPRLAVAAPGISPAVDALVARMLDIDAAKRPTAAEVLTELAAMSPTSQRDLAPVPVRSRRSAVIGAILAIAVVGTAGVAWWRTARSVPAGRPVIAVLPFANLSGDTAKDYLGVGISDALNTNLSRFAAVSVIPHSTVEEAGALRMTDVVKIASSVGATMILQGSVQTSGPRLRVSANLMSADGKVVWSGDSETTETELFSAENRLAESLIDALRIAVSDEQLQRMAKPPTANRAALDAYWQGLAELYRNANDPEHFDRAIASLRNAVARDPGFSLAYAALGDAYRGKSRATNDPAMMDEATAQVTEALRIDPDQPEVRLSLANLYRATGRNGAAVEELKRLLGTRPSNDEAHRLLGEILADEGRTNEAFAELQRAIELRPQYWRNQRALGQFSQRSGKFSDAIAAFTRLVALKPDDYLAYQQLGTAYQLQGDKARARENYERSIALNPNASSYTNLGTILYTEGNYVAAARAYEQAIGLAPKRALYRRNLGDTYLKLHRRDDARAAYEKAVQLTEESLTVNPSDALTLSQLGVYEAKLGRRIDAERHVSGAAALNPTSADVLYRRAVVLSLNGKLDDALVQLKASIGRGFSKQAALEDDDLSALRSRPAFQSLLAPSK
jgi:serine/threonine protein kinase/tetratricopeptide (TPR) repeat protein